MIHRDNFTRALKRLFGDIKWSFLGLKCAVLYLFFADCDSKSVRAARVLSESVLHVPTVPNTSYRHDVGLDPTGIKINIYIFLVSTPRESPAACRRRARDRVCAFGKIVRRGFSDNER